MSYLKLAVIFGNAIVCCFTLYLLITYSQVFARDLLYTQEGTYAFLTCVPSLFYAPWSFVNMVFAARRGAPRYMSSSLGLFWTWIVLFTNLLVLAVILSVTEFIGVTVAGLVFSSAMTYMCARYISELRRYPIVEDETLLL